MKGVWFQRVQVPPRQGSSRPGSHPSGGSPSNVLASYKFNGLARLVVEDFEQPDVRLDYYDDYDGSPTPGTYEGLDRFGRVQQQVWRDYNAGAYVDRFSYAYDYNSNPLYRKNEHASGGAFSELYHTNDATANTEYDGLDRLKEFRRGTLDATPDSIADGNTTGRQVFTLDQVGNWDGFKTDAGPGDGGGGSWDLDQTRTQNDANEITDVTVWADPAYDARGNMKTVPKPSDLTSTFASKYDAWNRLALVYVDVNTNGDYDDGTDTLMAKYEYDGLNRRVKAHIDAQSPGSPNGVDHYRHFFYNSALGLRSLGEAGWQILETRKSTSEETGPETLDVEMQYVWSVRYIDSPVLRDRDADDDPETGDLGVTDSGLEERLYYLTDANMNVTALVGTDGTPLERYAYDPYGKVTVLDADFSEDADGKSDYDNRILFAGYYFDSETGLYHVRNRMYHPYLGWPQRDPGGYADGMNLYEYNSSDPTNGFDPYGLDRIQWERGEGAKQKDVDEVKKDWETAKRQATGPMKQEMEQIDNGRGRTTRIKVVRGKKSVVVGSSRTGEVDVEDIKAHPDSGPATKASKTAHEIVEQHAQQVDKQPYKKDSSLHGGAAHAEGVKAEEAVSGWERGAQKTEPGPGGGTKVETIYRKEVTVNGDKTYEYKNVVYNIDSTGKVTVSVVSVDGPNLEKSCK